MKRPQSKPVTRSSSGLPSAPARVVNNSAKPAKATPRKSGKPSKAVKTKAQKRFSLTAEARRFTQASRNRRIVVGTSLSAFGALLLLVLATIFTPLLAVEKIEVTGITRLKEKSIVNALISQIGKPLPTINSADVAKSLESFPLIESFSIISLPPHTLRIQIAERQPIGVIVVAGTQYLYDPAGVKIGIANGSENLPIIWSEYLKKKERSQSKIQSMETYVRADKTCRNRLITAYFGESDQANCGICDNCIQRKKEANGRAYPEGMEKERQLILNYLKNGAMSLQDLIECLRPLTQAEAAKMIQYCLEMGEIVYQSTDVLALASS